jgi:hypothetical protein
VSGRDTFRFCRQDDLRAGCFLLELSSPGTDENLMQPGALHCVNHRRRAPEQIIGKLAEG